MKAKSDLLAETRRKRLSRQSAPRRAVEVRMPRAQRRAHILEKAGQYFSEYGLTAQTRGLAEACGISQRLLYSFFPNKAALIEQVYRDQIEGPFKAVWLVQLRDRSVPVEQRIITFYCEYYEVILTRRWLRLFLYASLAEEVMAQTYISKVLAEILDLMLREAAFEAGLKPPRNRAQAQEIGWILHGAVSHLAIRRHIYHNDNPVPVERVIALHVRSYLAGLDSLLPTATD